MNKGLRCLAVVALLVVLTASNAFAIDRWSSWQGRSLWNRQGAGTTTQAWDFINNLYSPSYVRNEYGTPSLNVVHGSPQTVPGPGGGDIMTWHIDQDGGGITILVPNNPYPNLLKWIFLQYTSDKPSSGTPQVQTTPTASSTTLLGSNALGEGGEWSTYQWLIEVRPNPQAEWIFVPFPESTNIEEVWLDTVCTTPEPSSLLTLGASGLFTGMLALRRRRR